MNKILRILGITSLLSFNLVHASPPETNIYYQYGTQYFSDVNSYCTATLASLDGGTSATYDSASNRCYQYIGSQLTQVYPVQRVTADRCMPGATAPDTSKPYDQQCGVIAPVCTAGEVTSVRQTFATEAAALDAPFPNSVGACGAKTQELTSCWKYLDGSGYICDFKVKNTGVALPAGGSSPSNQSPSSAIKPPGTPAGMTPKAADASGVCPLGSVQGGVDGSGIPICIGTGTAPASPTVAPTTVTAAPVVNSNPDGGTTTTQSIVSTNADGSKTTTTTTSIVAADGSKTLSQVATVSKSTAGADGVSDSTDPNKNGFCQSNPNLTVCKNSSVAGVCGAVTCTGDAIQCSTLRAAAAMECRDKTDHDTLAASPLVASGNAAIAGADSMKGQADAMWKGDTVDLSSQNLDQSGFVGAGSCFPDKTFTVRGKSVTVSFATVCSNVQPLRYIILACAFIAAYMLISKSVLQS